MAIEYINTLQGDILTSYNNAALANLGQRIGAKGDSIVVKSFSLNDIFKNLDTLQEKTYIVLSYNNDTNSLSVFNDELLGENVIFKTNTNKTTITPIEYIGFSGTNITLNNCDVTKTQENSYFFKASVNSNNTEYYIAIEILEETDINIAILYSINNEKTLIVKNNDYKKYIVESLDNFNNISSFVDLINELNGIDSSNNLSDFEETLCNTLISTLPKYIVELYNDNTYFYDNYAGLNKTIIESIVKQLFSDSFLNTNGTVNGIENNPFFVYLPKSLSISFYVNDNTGIYYDSLPINVKFIKDNGDEKPIVDNNLFTDANINNYIVVDSDIEKAAAYKTYLEYDNLENISIRTDKLYSIPYIGSDNFWYINDIKTEVTATGKDAGNPNIIILRTSFEDTQSTDYDINDVDEIYFKQDGPKTLHTYVGINIGKENTNNTFDFVEFNYKLNFNESNKTASVSVGESKLNTYLFKVKLPSLYGDNGLVHDINFDSIIKNSLVFYIIDTRLSYFYDSNIQLTNADISELRKTSLQYKLTNNNSEQSFITVLFHIIKTTNENNEEIYIWEPLKNEETGTVLDLGSMISSAEFAELFTRITVNPDKYKFSQLVLDNVNFLHKNNTSTNTAKIYPIIKNDNSEFYITNTVDTVDNTTTSTNTNTIAVHNNTNITPKFVTISDIDDTGTDYLGEDFVLNEKPATKYINFNGDKFAESSFNTVENPKDLIPHEIWANNSGTGTYNTVSTIYPMFDFREVITTNQTAMNRLSLISLASSGVAYNAYIGNSANTNEEGTLYIGSSETNYSMAGNKTVTDDYDKFKKYKKINFELPVETNNLTIYKANDKYFTYINVAVPSSSYISTITHTISTKYMTETYAATYKTYTLNAYSYISNTYSGFINAASIPTSVELSNVTYDGESLPKSLLFIVNFNSYSNGKYDAESIEQIASSDSIIEGITELNNTTTNQEENGTQSQVIVEQ